MTVQGAPRAGSRQAIVASSKSNRRRKGTEVTCQQCEDSNEPQVPKRGPGYVSPGAHVTGFWEVPFSLTVTQNTSSGSRHPPTPPPRGPQALSSLITSWPYWTPSARESGPSAMTCHVQVTRLLRISRAGIPRVMLTAQEHPFADATPPPVGQAAHSEAYSFHVG